MMKEAIPDEILYYYDAPLFLTIKRGKELLLAICHDMDEKAVKYYAVHTNVREVEAVKGNKVSLRGVLQGKPWEEFELGAKGNLAPTGQVGEFIANESLPSPGYGLSFEYSDLPDNMA